MIYNFDICHIWLHYFRQGLPNLGDIEHIHKKRAHDKDSRLATVMVSSIYYIIQTN